MVRNGIRKSLKIIIRESKNCRLAGLIIREFF